MLASLLRPKKRRVYADRSPFSSPYTQSPSLRRPQPQNGDYPQFPVGNNPHDNNSDDTDEDDRFDGELEDPESAPLLPIFSASHLGTKRATAAGGIQTNKPSLISRCAARIRDYPRHPSLDRVAL